MFYCVIHNWYSSEAPCPACHQTITTSASTNLQDILGVSNKLLFSQADAIIKKYFPYAANEMYLKLRQMMDEAIEVKQQSKQLSGTIKAGEGTANDVGNEGLIFAKPNQKSYDGDKKSPFVADEIGQFPSQPQNNKEGVITKKGDERTISFSATIYTEEDLKKAFYSKCETFDDYKKTINP